MANTDRRGMEASMPPTSELFFDASETITISTADKATLITY